VRPLRRPEPILERQDAIAELKGTDVGFGTSIKFRKELTKLPDMERLLPRLYSSSGATGRNADRVVLYEDAAKKQLQEFIAALHGCQCMIQACLSFNNSLGERKSSLLQHILTPGKGLPDARPTIKHFETAFDWSEAEKTGHILPCEGVDEDYDVANRTVREIEIELEKHLENAADTFWK
jgi:DNA mismatch repair protein MSH6